LEATNFAGAHIGQFSGAGVANVSHADDASLIVKFFLHPVKQGAESEKAGRPIFKDVEYIWIRFAGDRTREIKRPVDMEGRNGNAPDPERFPKAWMAFKNSQAVVHEGTPLEQFPPLGASTVLNFKAFNVHTVEQLASVSDAVLHNLGTGGRELRQKAQDWLKAATSAATVTQLRDELAKRDLDIAALTAQVKELAALAEKQKGK
jgi:hypothetical protein